MRRGREPGRWRYDLRPGLAPEGPRRSAAFDEAARRIDALKAQKRWLIPFSEWQSKHAGAISATHAKLFVVDRPKARRIEMVGTAHELPDQGYALEVDGRMKAEFATRDGAKAGGEELKRRFPKLLIRIYDAQTKTREEISLQGF